ncbi:MAG: YCF48-related protein [Gammaproteobacteria bacterium]|nr:YCF48-related protein [Gammaproteobacteria bacterium]
MQGINTAIKRMALGLITAVPLMGTGVVQAEEGVKPDFRYLPAVKSPRVERSLLLDATRADGRMIAVGERGFVIYSDDDGQSWSQAEVPVSVTLTAVSFPTPKMGWAVGHEGTILHSADGGSSWAVQLSGQEVAVQEVSFSEGLIEQMQQQLASADELDLEELQFELDDAQYALEDAQESVTSGGTPNPFLDVWFADEKKGIAVGAYGLFFRTNDGGEHWTTASSALDNLDKYHYYSLSSPDGQTVYLSGEAGMLFRSEDMGENWVRLESPYEGSFFGILAQPNGAVGRVVTFGLRGNIFVSDDRGETWEERMTENENTLMGGSFTADGRLVIVGRSGTVLSSDDGGENFSVLYRDDRGSYGAVITGSDGNLIVVGEGGIHHAGPDGSSR